MKQNVILKKKQTCTSIIIIILSKDAKQSIKNHKLYE